MLTNPYLLLSGGQFSYNFFARNGVKCIDLPRKLMLFNLQIGKDRRQLTNIFVFDIALFCVLDPNPNPFVVIWEKGKHEFPAVLYISYISIKHSF